MLIETKSVSGLSVKVLLLDLARAMNSGFPYVITDDGRIVMLET